MNNREKILEQGTKYANENWNVHENPNEHDNAHDDFIAGALWAVKNCSIPDVSVSSPKIHLVDVDGDIIESLNIMSHAKKLRDAINSDPESIAHHYQVIIRDER